MIERIFDLPGLLIIGGFTVAGFLLPLIFADVRKVMRGVEAAILALLGGAIARGFISVLLAWANDSHRAGLVVGWGFFLIPGLVDTFASKPILTTPAFLLDLAAIVGGLTGMMAGIYRIYDWKGLGWLAFPLDVTWSLAGSTLGGLLHLINAGWGDHSDEVRENAHRYASGFTLIGSGLTGGNVMSHVEDAAPSESLVGGPIPTVQHWPAGPIYSHEYTHVWQNRIFGPLFMLTYFAWMLVWLIPGMIAGVVVKGIGGIFTGVYRWSYINNPWEAWASDAGEGRENPSDTDDDKKLTWSAGNVKLWSIPFFLISAGLAVYISISAWSGSDAHPPAAPPAAHTSKPHSPPGTAGKHRP